MKEQLGARLRLSEAPATSLIPPGSRLEIQPVIERMRCHPVRQEVMWLEKLVETRFEVEYVGPQPDGDACRGTVQVCNDGLLVAQVPVTFTVSTSPSPTATALRSETAKMVREVFASYAHEDAMIVHRCRAAYRALGIQLFVDEDGIPSGRLWQPYLAEQITRSDLFQLFWSQDSAASENVEDEWRHALDVAGQRPTGTDFIRPVYWSKPHPPIPKPLQPINFSYVDPNDLGVAGTGIVQPGSSGSSSGAGQPFRRPTCVFR